MHRCIAVTVVGLGVANLAVAECPLSGTWKSNAAMTLAGIAASSDARAESMNVLSDDVFGHMVHSWTCAELLAWFDHEDPGKPVPYRIVEQDEQSIWVSFPGGEENDLRLVFEGDCYRIRFEGQHYAEYFCPVKEGG